MIILDANNNKKKNIDIDNINEFDNIELKSIKIDSPSNNSLSK